MKRIVLGVAAVLSAVSVHAQQGDGTNIGYQTKIFKPDKIEATPERIASLQVPEGFSIAPFATGLKNVRIIAISPDGAIYVSRRDQGDVLLLKDADHDGKADGAPIVVANRAGAHGLAIHDGKLYLVTVKEVFRADIASDGTLGPLTMIIGDLPDSGQHPNRTLAFGPDGMLYISVGSTCNACNDSNPESATLLQASPDGKSRIIFASGLRNTIGFAWNPATGELWGLDHGIDFLGDEVQQEELNKIEKGKRYGWPHVFADGGINPQSTPAGDVTKEQWKAMSTPMTLGYAAHAAPMQLVFNTGASFPREYKGDAFATMRGSWNRNPASGYEIVRIRFKNGAPTAIEPFVSGFLTDGGKTHIARPVGLAQMADGALLMSDDGNGTIYRIAYDASASKAVGGPRPSTIPTGPMKSQSAAGIGVPLTMERRETKTTGTLRVNSRNFASAAAIPAMHSEYADGVAPQIEWTAVDGAKSYALIMEDPDAKPITPFVHWVVWNIPANVSNLPEGLQEQMRLTEPDGLLQGATSRGSVGYFGPHPPVGDPPHHYHFQVLALDAMLDVPPGATRDQVLKAATGHVIGKGELVGTYQQTIKPPK